jgi:Tol biopolymer transport system component
VSGARRQVDLEDPPLWIRDLDWSATSDLLLYVTHDESDSGAIRVVSADGQRQAQVIEESGSIPSARWSPRGDAIYYLHRRGTSTEIRRVHVDPASGERRGQPRFVIALPQADGRIGLSADGKRLVYLECNISSNLWLASMPKDGEAGTPKWERLTTGTYVDRGPRFSPSGTSIVFSRGIGSKQNLFVLDLSTEEPRQLTFSDSLDLSPVWSPDGTTIAFVSDRSGEARVWRVSTVGGEPTPVETSEVGLRSDSLDWASTGTILFRPPDLLDLYVVDPDGGKERSLREGIEDPAFQPLPARRYVGMTVLWVPRFSPDGQRVAAGWGGSRGRTGLWSLPVTGGAVARLLPGTGYPIGWSSDGSVVYAVTSDERPMRVAKIRVSDGEREDMCELPFEEIVKLEGHVSPDGRKLVISVRHTESDIWLVENFDPESER